MEGIFLAKGKEQQKAAVNTLGDLITCTTYKYTTGSVSKLGNNVQLL